MATALRRSPRDLPLLLALAGLCAALVFPGSPVLLLPLLFCPGWGLLRCVSEMDRNFGVLGAACCGSALVLGLTTVLGAAAELPPERLGLWVHGISIALCAAGRVRIARYDRWHAGQPPHPAPMPLWPGRSASCLLLLGLVLSAALYAVPRDEARSIASVETAAFAAAWSAGGEHPLDAGRNLRGRAFFAAAVGGLSAASGVAPLRAAPVLSLAALLACLLMVAEGSSRLWGNRGGTRAMLAFLLGVNPLAGILLWTSAADEPLPQRLGGGFDPGITTAIAPFLDSAPMSLTLAFTTLLLFTTLSVLRRASRHVPRIMTWAVLGLVLCDARAALVLLPGWVLGIGMAHLACRESADNDVLRSGLVRRPREPRVLRAPFWRPALHLAAGLVLAWPLVDMPAFVVDPTRFVAFGLLAGLGPGCILFLPGIRHLNASPGREAFFFVGVCVLAGMLGLALRFPGDDGALAVRLLAAVLAVPASIGCMKLVELHGARATVPLVLSLGVLWPGPVAALQHVRRSEPWVRIDSAGRTEARTLDVSVLEALHVVAERSDADSILLLDPTWIASDVLVAQLVARRPLGHGLDAERRRDVASLAAGDGTALQRLRGHPAWSGRPLWAVHGGEPWPGMSPVTRVGSVRVERARPPDVVLVTIASLRADRVTTTHMPHLAGRGRDGLLFATALTPSPQTLPGLATLLSGLAPMDHDLRDDTESGARGMRTLAQDFGARGYRTQALVALDPHDALLAGFEDAFADRRARAPFLVERALDGLAGADSRPLFLWVHLSELELPYRLPAAARTGATGASDFPVQADLKRTVHGVAAFPPTPREGGVFPGEDEVDVETGRAQYDALLSVVDANLARLLESVPADDLLVVTAPHGTSLDEHEHWFGHGADLFEPSVRVPLLVAGAGMPAGTSQRLASLQDVKALLLEGRLPDRQRVGMESGWRPGLATGRAHDPVRDASSRGAALRIWAERSATHKTILVREERPGAPAVGVTYDLVRDPDELRPYPADPFVLRRIDAWRRLGRMPTAPGSESPER